MKHIFYSGSLKSEDNIMAINKTTNGTFRLRKKYPNDIVEIMELKNPHFDKIFKTLKAAKLAELDFENDIQEIRKAQNTDSLEYRGDMSFTVFYTKLWLEAYINGSTSSHQTPPTQPTIQNTKDIFRLHILPMFGDYKLNYLNNHLEFVLPKMTIKAKEYANFKTVRSYVNQVFDLAEQFGYIEHNRLSKPLKKIKSLKKINLAESKLDEDKYLNEKDLNCWFKAINEDYKNGDLTMQDYTMFWTTFFLTCRKSECYALQWKHIDFENNCIHLEQTLDRNGIVKVTKGRKKTDIIITENLKNILVAWKAQQEIELKQLGITQSLNQFLFSYCDTQGNINKHVHTDFLNYRMKTVEKRHPELTHASPHKLRHTSASLASKHGMSLDAIMEALTHEDQETTKIYVNIKSTVAITPADFIFKNISESNYGD